MARVSEEETVAAASSSGQLVAAALPAVTTPRLPPRASLDGAIADAAEVGTDIGAAVQLPAGSFRRACGVCKRSYTGVHHFYHRLCPECAELNWRKRGQTADLGGRVVLGWWGGRIVNTCGALGREGLEILTSRFRNGDMAFCILHSRPDDCVRSAW